MPEYWCGAAARSSSGGGSRVVVRPGGRLAGWQGHVERVQRERHQRVVAAQRDELDDASITEQLPGGVVGGPLDVATCSELAGDGVHDTLVVGQRRRGARGDRFHRLLA